VEKTGKPRKKIVLEFVRKRELGRYGSGWKSYIGMSLKEIVFKDV
jgi:hypothetical protein